MTNASVERSAEHSGVMFLNVAVLVSNVVLRRGLESILRQLPIVRSVRVWAQEDALVEVPVGDIDVIIVTAGETDLVHERRWSASARVLLLLGQAEAADPALVAGLNADGFLIQENLTTADLGDALDRLAAGEMPMPAQLGRLLLARVGSPSAAHPQRPTVLTSRETETLSLLAEGLSNKQIARRLSISDHGAKRLVTSVLLKLGAPNRTAAVVIAMKAGVIASP